jgi:hypothetical protein
VRRSNHDPYAALNKEKKRAADSVGKYVVGLIVYGPGRKAKGILNIPV